MGPDGRRFLSASAFMGFRRGEEGRKDYKEFTILFQVPGAVGEIGNADGRVRPGI